MLNKAKGKNRKYCKDIKKKIYFFFNDDNRDKSEELKQNISEYIDQCQIENKCQKCKYECKVGNYQFQNIFSEPSITDILRNNKLGKFVLLDQYGFSQIDDSVFTQLISFPKTDFIFFISSSFISRFREHENTKKYIDTSRIDFNNIKPMEIHRAIAQYFRDLIPEDKEYYLHHFSIQKDCNKGNYYGLIFGSNHTFGMEKFLKVCWEHDKFSGEANFNIDNNYTEDTLFYDPEKPIKKERVREIIKNQILTGIITDNITGLKFALGNGCEPKLFTEVVRELEKDGLIKRQGTLNYQSTNIHKADKYNIERLNCHEQA